MRLRLFDLALALGACCSLAVLVMEFAPSGSSMAQQRSTSEQSTPSTLDWTPSDALPTTVTALLPADKEAADAGAGQSSSAASPEPEPTRSAETAQAGARQTPSAQASDAPSPLPSGTTRHSEAAPDASKAIALLDRMNNERIDRGLGMLERNAALDEVALARARDLVANGYFDHYAPDGRSAFTELAARGLPYRLAGENLARNNYPPNQTVEAAIHGLMASPGHRDNVLEPRFAAVGLAVIQDGGMWYYVTVFTNPR